MFIPADFFPLGILWAEYGLFVIPVFLIVEFIYYSTRFLAGKTRLVSVLGSVFFVILCLVMYANHHDRSVRLSITYENNSMFDTVEECDAYWYSVRRNNCREDWTTLHNRWNQQTVASNPNLVLGQTLRPDSGNYQFFPQEHLVDIKVGTGDMAKEGENAVVNIVSADIRGTTYTNLVSVVSRTADPGTFKNKVINMTPHYLPGYYSYYLGVIGMRVGGTRDITFTSDENFLFTGSKLPIEVKAAEPITYRVELLSLKGDRFYQEDLEP